MSRILQGAAANRGRPARRRRLRLAARRRQLAPRRLLLSPPTVCRLPADEAQSHPRLVEWVDDLLKRFPPGHHAVLMLTSPGHGADKAGVSAALAEALAARLPGEVLAVGRSRGRLRSCRDSRGFADRAGSAGLAGVLAGEATWEDSIRPAPRKWLDVLPAGRAWPKREPLRAVRQMGTALRRVTSTRLAAVFDDLRSRYRFVVIDGPCLAQPEAAAMAACCDGVFLVVALGQTRRGAARRAVSLLQRGGANVLGCVVAGE